MGYHERKAHDLYKRFGSTRKLVLPSFLLVPLQPSAPKVGQHSVWCRIWESIGQCVVCWSYSVQDSLLIRLHLLCQLACVCVRGVTSRSQPFRVASPGVRDRQRKYENTFVLLFFPGGLSCSCWQWLFWQLGRGRARARLEPPFDDQKVGRVEISVSETQQAIQNSTRTNLVGWKEGGSPPVFVTCIMFEMVRNIHITSYIVSMFVLPISTKI